MLDMGLWSDDDMFQVGFEEELDHMRMMDEVVNPEGNADVAEEMDVGEENHVVVVGLAPVGNQNAEGVGEAPIIDLSKGNGDGVDVLPVGN